MRRLGKLFAAVTIGIFPAFALAASTYNITPITPPSGDDLTVPFSMNNNDQIVGISGNTTIDAAGIGKLTGSNGLQEIDGFLFSGGKVTILPNLGTTPDDKSGTFPLGINDSAEIVGSTSTPQGNIDVIYQNGTFTNFSTLLGIPASATGGFGGSVPVAVNNSGEIVGTLKASSSTSATAYLYNGTVHDIPTISSTYPSGVALALNASGEAVGGDDNVLGKNNIIEHAFLYDGTTHDLGTLTGDNASFAGGINKSGNVIGWSGVAPTPTSTLPSPGLNAEFATIGSGLSGISAMFFSAGLQTGHAFFYNGATKQMVDLGTLGGAFSLATGINDSNDIVGTAMTSAGNYDAFVDDGTVMVDLNTLLPADSGWQLITASNINNRGDIAGLGLFDGVYQGYLLTPGSATTGGNGGTGGGTTTAVPLPSPLLPSAILLSVLCAMGAIKSRRARP
jgi:probable HAF family extracellular repeat protein